MVWFYHRYRIMGFLGYAHARSHSPSHCCSIPYTVAARLKILYRHVCYNSNQNLKKTTSRYSQKHLEYHPNFVSLESLKISVPSPILFKPASKAFSTTIHKGKGPPPPPPPPRLARRFPLLNESYQQQVSLKELLFTSFTDLQHPPYLVSNSFILCKHLGRTQKLHKKKTGIKAQPGRFSRLNYAIHHPPKDIQVAPRIIRTSLMK